MKLRWSMAQERERLCGHGMVVSVFRRVVNFIQALNFRCGVLPTDIWYSISVQLVFCQSLILSL